MFINKILMDYVESYYYIIMNKCSPKIEINGNNLQLSHKFSKQQDSLYQNNYQNCHSPSLKTLFSYKNLNEKIFITPPTIKKTSAQNMIQINELPTINLRKHESQKFADNCYGKLQTQQKQVRSNYRLLEASLPIQLLDIPKVIDYRKSLTKSKQKIKFIRKSGQKQRNHFETTPRKNNFLKETISTVSTDARCPSFVKLRNHKEKNQNRFCEDNFVKIKEIGRGKFGKVWIVRKTNFCLALKIVDKNYIKNGNNLNQFIRELKIQAYLNHPSIIKLYGFFNDESNFYIILQLGCDGQLYNLIAKKVKFSQQSVSFIIKNLLQGIDYMHNMKILHRDVKPQNIVVTHGTVKLCDFGCAVQMNENQLRSTFCGTPLYFSPELLKNRKYDQKVDLWAIGILAYEMFYNHSPFQICTEYELEKIMTDEINFEQCPISQEFKNFLEQVLEKNPQKRLSSKELLKTQFIQAYKELETCQQLCR